MKLYLVQHGDAVSKEENPDRPLSSKGRQDVQRMASFLARSVKVSRIIHSGKLRASQTALLFAEVLGAGIMVEEAAEGLAAGDSTDRLALAIQGWPNDLDVMVAGHLPFMARMVSRLAAGDENTAAIAFQPGSVACLERNEKSEWTLNWITRPELLGG